MPFVVDDFFDEVRLDAEAAVSKHRIRCRHLHRVGLARSERERQVRWMLLGIEGRMEPSTSSVSK